MAYAGLGAVDLRQALGQTTGRGLHQTEDLLAQLVPVWHLDCLKTKALPNCAAKAALHGS